ATPFCLETSVRVIRRISPSKNYKPTSEDLSNLPLLAFIPSLYDKA
uniref:Uncharacterized protein n=1 Tax=Anopheles atroparvus TaxID=41427 RepID=A0AAG5CWB5_ANOAO